MYIHNVLKRCIYLVWLLLFICNLTAMFLPNIFLISDNGNLMFISKLIDSNLHYTFIFSLVSSSSLLIPYILLIYKIKWFDNKKQLYLTLLIILFNSIFKVYFPGILAMTYEVSMFIVYPIVDIYCKNKTVDKYKFLNPIVCYFYLVVCIQLLSLPLRSLDLEIYASGFSIINLIYYIDSLVIIYLYYFYICHGGGCVGTNLFTFFKRGISTIRSISRYFKRWSRKNRSSEQNSTLESRNNKT